MNNRPPSTRHTYNGFDKILQQLRMGSTGLPTNKSTRNMVAAKGNSNILMRAQTMADQGINVRKPTSTLDRYLSRYNYINRYVRKPI